MKHITHVLLALLVGLVVVACRASAPAVDCRAETVAPGSTARCALPGHTDRSFLLHVPREIPRPAPVLIALHGGGGDKEGFDPLTCPDGRSGSPGCLVHDALEAGFVVVVPDGTPNPFGFRTWNQADPQPGLQCPYACEQRVDDVAWFRGLLSEVAATAAVDPARVFVAGFSNGAAMAHRLACEAADTIAAVVAVGGANQQAEAGRCAPTRAVPLLQIHGVDDPCWPFAGGEGRCLRVQKGRYASVVGTMDGWAARRGCTGGPQVDSLPDMDGDGVGPRRHRWEGCSARVELLEVRGGGHTWPGGHAYLKASRIGRVSRDLSASRVVLEFFGAAIPR